MKSTKLFTVIFNTQLKEAQEKLKSDPLNLGLAFLDTFGTYQNRVDAVDRVRIINRIYKRDNNISQAVNILEH